MMTNLIGRAMCAVGLHSVISREKWTPSIPAKVVTEFERTHTCARCEKVTLHVHYRWNGEEMVDVVTPSPDVNG